MSNQLLEIDLSWKNPPEHQLAALALAKKRRVVLPKSKSSDSVLPDSTLMMAAYKLGVDRTDYLEVAEFICMSQESFWYAQAKNWTVNPPEKLTDEISRASWRLACDTICRIIEMGYDAEKKEWWNLRGLENAKARMIVLADFGMMLERYKASFSLFDYMQGSVPKISGGFEVFLNLVLGNGWKTRYLRATTPTPEPAKCIKPECENLVAAVGVSKPSDGVFKNYRGTGACQKGHNGYFCQKCDAPHSYASGVGRSHYKPGEAVSA